ncbi:MAG: NAD(P)-binding protein, partial [Mycobacteriales bacterium]
MSTLPQVAVIGAGSSGITALKALVDRGFEVVCYELGDRVGGNWVLNNTNGMSSAYRSLHINTSRERMAYADFPMPRHYPDFPHHTHIAEYFDSYVRHFGLESAIRFGVGVSRAERARGGGWQLSLTTGETAPADA